MGHAPGWRQGAHSRIAASVVPKVYKDELPHTLTPSPCNANHVYPYPIDHFLKNPTHNPLASGEPLACHPRNAQSSHSPHKLVVPGPCMQSGPGPR
jgi:hypothetical protein